MSRLQTLRCGGCGCATVTLAAAKHPHLDAFTRIDATCTKCRSVTKFELEPSTIRASMKSPRSLGMLCVGWSDDKE